MTAGPTFFWGSIATREGAMEFEKDEFSGLQLFDWLLMGALAVLVVIGLLGLTGIAGDLWAGLRNTLGVR